MLWLNPRLICGYKILRKSRLFVRFRTAVGTRPYVKARLACILLRHTVKTNQPFVVPSPLIVVIAFAMDG